MSRTRRLILALGLLLIPAVAWAHAHLKRSEPAAGSRINGPPQVIRFWFSERPEVSMTFVSMKDASGKEITLDPPENDRGDPLELSVRVNQALEAGRYTVAWRTAASDGHPSHGSFSFVVLTGIAPPGHAAVPQTGAATDTIGGAAVAAASSANPESVEDADAASSVSNSLARTFSFVGLLALIGAIAFRTLVLPRARGTKEELTALMARRTAVLGFTASVLVIVSAFARVFLESQMMSAMPDMQTMSMADMTMHTRWGVAVSLEFGAALLALVSFALAVRRIRGAWLVASISAIVLALTPALVGHAAASPRFTTLMIVSDFLHVLGGASWLGSLLAVMVVGIPLSLTLDGAERWSTVASLVNSFSPIALTSAAVVIVSGLIASWVHVEHLSDLWQTAYGRVLLLKLLLVAITLTIGAYNFRRVQPQLANEVGSARLKCSAALELSVAFLILLVTGFLTGISP
jgi:copper transport protein